LAKTNRDKKKKGSKLIAIAGNPNTGKSTLFNGLTGVEQEIGNWPGVTVEKKSGSFDCKGKRIQVVDLPGTYSLTAFSADELVARNFIVEEKPDVVVNIVDASNLERNLYLTTQLKEMHANLVIALNMMDVAERRGFTIDTEKLSEILDAPVVPMIASKGKGFRELRKAILNECKSHAHPLLKVDYGRDLEAKIKELEDHISAHASPLAEKYGARWLAVKLLENDKEIIRAIKKQDTDIYDKSLKNFMEKAEQIFGDSLDLHIADRRYGFANGIVRKVVSVRSTARRRRSDRLDQVLTNAYLGIPLFLLIMFMTYQLVFIGGAPIVAIVEGLLGVIASQAESFLLAINAPSWASGLILSALIEGVGNVLVFLPNIMLLFAAIAFLEDSGYMARAAFVMDRVMAKMGLHGKAFISLVIGLGCNVPGVMAARTIKEDSDRMVAVLINSLVPCSARMEVFIFLAGAFFAPQVAGWVVFSMLLMSFVLVFVIGKLFRKFLFPGEAAPLVIELPPYKLPTLKGLAIHTWNRTKAFVEKAGTFIFIVAILIWFLASYPSGVEYGGAESYIGLLGHAFEPLMAPLGFDWKATVALIFGFLAKEVVIAAFGVLYGVGEEATLQAAMAQVWTPLQAYAFMVFTLLYVPCFATVAVIKQETNSWKWTLFAVGYLLVLAWLAAYAVILVGSFLGYA